MAAAEIESPGPLDTMRAAEAKHDAEMEEQLRLDREERRVAIRVAARDDLRRGRPPRPGEPGAMCPQCGSENSADSGRCFDCDTVFAPRVITDAAPPPRSERLEYAEDAATFCRESLMQRSMWPANLDEAVLKESIGTLECLLTLARARLAEVAP